MIVTNAHRLVALDAKIGTLYGQLADLGQRRELSKSQSNDARALLLRRVMRLRRRREGLPGVRSQPGNAATNESPPPRP